MYSGSCVYPSLYFLYEMYKEGKYKSPYLSTVETVLNGTGLSGMWTNISLTEIILTSGFSLKLHEFYEISISNNGPLKLNQRKYVTIIECL